MAITATQEMEAQSGKGCLRPKNWLVPEPVQQPGLLTSFLPLLSSPFLLPISRLVIVGVYRDTFGWVLESDRGCLGVSLHKLPIGHLALGK